MTLREIKDRLMLAQKLSRVVVRDVTELSREFKGHSESRKSSPEFCFDY